ncbi:glycosyltransferase [Dyella psychrodurans]|nr:glycosyltransferase [Dyella psychrodurans]
MRTTLNIPDPLFVSGPNGGGLLYVHRHVLMPLDDEETTGLALTDDGLIWCVQGDESRTLRAVRGGMFDSSSISPNHLDLHDVMVGSDGIYAVFTETNEVVHLDKSYQLLESWRFGEKPDSAHVNSINVYNGRLIASLFGRFVEHRGYKGHTKLAGRVVDVRSDVSLIEGLSQPHSLVVVDEKLWLCNSEDREIHIYNLDFTLSQKIALPGYTRGLAVGANHVYVGLSRSRNCVASDIGEFTSAVIAVLDRDSLGIIGFVPLPWNEIYDIRIAPSADVVTNVMTAMWLHERTKQPIRIEEARQKVRVEGARHLEAVEAAHLAAQARAVEVCLAQAEATHKKALAEASRLLDDANGYLADEVRAREECALVIEQLQTDLFVAREERDLAIEQWRTELSELREERELTIGKLQEELAESRTDVSQREGFMEELERQIDQITRSRSWRWTWPMRALMYLLRGYGLLGKADHIAAGRARHQLRRIKARARAITRPTVSVPSVHLAPSATGMRDVFVWALIDWNYRIQRPQHLAREFAARGHRVFYISNNFVDRQEPGFSVEPLDETGRLFRVQLHLKGSPPIYYKSPDLYAQKQLRESVSQLLTWTRSRACLSLVEHPFWLGTSRVLPNQQLVYDCMDHHGGFSTSSPDFLNWEIDLMRAAHLLVVTSDWLYTETSDYNPHRLMIRNACQYEHFAVEPELRYKDKQGRKIIGYYGAIAEWIDLDLLAKVAMRFPDCLLLMVGNDTAGARQHLRHLSNVEFIGEVPYATLPFYLASFDVCLLPFQVIPLTLATNPVKVYEYLCAGKEVVSISLPEMHQFGDLVRTGHDHATFLDQVDKALFTELDPALIEERQQFAAGQTWTHRINDLVGGLATLPQPQISVIVVTYNNLELTKACLDSIERYSDYANLEIIVVDNASEDDTPVWLTTWSTGGRDRKLILNKDNRGFSAANNQGLVAASGDYLVLLNNDTYVTPGWIATLLAHLDRSETLGIVGPVTNNIGNEARIDISYDTMESMLDVAADYTLRHAGQLTPLRTAAFFCVMLRRAVYEEIGPLDEAFGLGYFEDDDYCRRVEEAGWTIACADDVFIHHHLSASFNTLRHETRQALFDRNKAIYEAKWGDWEPHRYRYG